MISPDRLERYLRLIAPQEAREEKDYALCHLVTEVRRLNAVLAEKEDIIHRLNDKLEAALGGEDPWNKVCHQCNNPNCMLRRDCEH